MSFKNDWDALPTASENERSKLYKNIAGFVSKSANLASIQHESVSIEQVLKDLENKKFPHREFILRALSIMMSSEGKSMVTVKQKHQLSSAIGQTMSDTGMTEMALRCFTYMNAVRINEKLVPQILESMILCMNKNRPDSAWLNHNKLVERMLKECLPEMEAHVTKVSKCVFLSICHKDVKVRNLAKSNCSTFHEILTRHNLEVSAVLVEMLKSKTYLIQDMIRLFPYDEIYVLQVWKLLVTLLDQTMFSNVAVINAMMNIAEKAFKSSKETVIRETLSSWTLLIKIFTQNSDVNAKKLQLFMRPLVGKLHKCPAVFSDVRDTYWSLCMLLGENLPQHFEIACIPLLEFFLPSIKDNTKSPNSSIKEMPFMLETGLGMLLRFLEQKQTSKLFSAPLPGSMPIQKLPVSIPVNTLLKHFKKLVQASEVVVTALGQQSEFGSHSHALIMSLMHIVSEAQVENDNFPYWESIASFFQFICNIVNKELCYSDYCTKLLHYASQCPTKLLLSSHLSFGSTGAGIMLDNLATSLMMLLLKPFILQYGSESWFLSAFQNLVKVCIKSGVHLGYAQFFLTLISSENVLANANSEILASLWSSVAVSLLSAIQETKEINEGDQTDYDFRCMYSMLSYPVAHCLPPKCKSNSEVKLVLKVWKDLYSAFIECASNMSSLDGNAVCEAVCVELKKSFNIKSLEEEEYFEAVCQIVTEVRKHIQFSYVPKTFTVRKNTFGDSPFLIDKQNPMGNLASFVDIMGFILNGCCTKFDQLYESKVAPQKKTMLFEKKYHPALELFLDFLTSISSTTLFPLVLDCVVPPLATLFGRGLGRTQQIGLMVEKFLKTFLDVIQNKSPCYDQALLCTMTQLLKVMLCHPRKIISDRAKVFWVNTFGKQQQALDFPKDLKGVLIMKGMLFTDPEASPMDGVASSGSLCGNTPELKVDIQELNFPSTSWKYTPVQNKTLKLSKYGRNSAPPAFSSIDSLPAEEFVKIDQTPTSSKWKKLMRKSFVPVMYNDLSQSSATEGLSQMSDSNSQLVPTSLKEKFDNISSINDVNSQKSSVVLMKKEEVDCIVLNDSDEEGVANKEMSLAGELEDSTDVAPSSEISANPEVVATVSTESPGPLENNSPYDGSHVSETESLNDTNTYKQPEANVITPPISNSSDEPVPDNHAEIHQSCEDLMVKGIDQSSDLVEENQEVNTLDINAVSISGTIHVASEIEIKTEPNITPKKKARKKEVWTYKKKQKKRGKKLLSEATSSNAKPLDDGENSQPQCSHDVAESEDLFSDNCSKVTDTSIQSNETPSKGKGRRLPAKSPVKETPDLVPTRTSLRISLRKSSRSPLSPPNLGEGQSSSQEPCIGGGEDSRHSNMKVENENLPNNSVEPAVELNKNAQLDVRVPEMCSDVENKIVDSSPKAQTAEVEVIELQTSDLAKRSHSTEILEPSEVAETASAVDAEQTMDSNKVHNTVEIPESLEVSNPSSVCEEKGAKCSNVAVAHQDLHSEAKSDDDIIIVKDVPVSDDIFVESSQPNMKLTVIRFKTMDIVATNQLQISVSPNVNKKLPGPETPTVSLNTTSKCSNLGSCSNVIELNSTSKIDVANSSMQKTKMKKPTIVKISPNSAAASSKLSKRRCLISPRKTLHNSLAVLTNGIDEYDLKDMEHVASPPKIIKNDILRYFSVRNERVPDKETQEQQQLKDTAKADYGKELNQNDSLKSVKQVVGNEQSCSLEVEVTSDVPRNSLESADTTYDMLNRENTPNTDIQNSDDKAENSKHILENAGVEDMNSELFDNVEILDIATLPQSVVTFPESGSSEEEVKHSQEQEKANGNNSSPADDTVVTEPDELESIKNFVMGITGPSKIKGKHPKRSRKKKKLVAVRKNDNTLKIVIKEFVADAPNGANSDPTPQTETTKEQVKESVVPKSETKVLPNIQGARKRKNSNPIRSPITSRLRRRKQLNFADVLKVKSVKTSQLDDTKLAVPLTPENEDEPMAPTLVPEATVAIAPSDDSAMDGQTVVNGISAGSDLNDIVAMEGTAKEDKNTASPVTSLKGQSPFSRTQRILEASRQHMSPLAEPKAEERAHSPSVVLELMSRKNDLAGTPTIVPKRARPTDSPTSTPGSAVPCKRLCYNDLPASPQTGILKKMQTDYDAKNKTSNNKKSVAFASPLYEQRIFQPVTRRCLRRRIENIVTPEILNSPDLEQPELGNSRQKRSKILLGRNTTPVLTFGEHLTNGHGDATEEDNTEANGTFSGIIMETMESVLETVAPRREEFNRSTFDRMLDWALSGHLRVKDYPRKERFTVLRKIHALETIFMDECE